MKINLYRIASLAKIADESDVTPDGARVRYKGKEGIYEAPSKENHFVPYFKPDDGSREIEVKVGDKVEVIEPTQTPSKVGGELEPATARDKQVWNIGHYTDPMMGHVEFIDSSGFLEITVLLFTGKDSAGKTVHTVQVYEVPRDDPSFSEFYERSFQTRKIAETAAKYLFRQDPLYERELVKRGYMGR